MSIRLRLTLALLLGLVICAALVIPFVLVINRYDWGVGLLLVAPLLVWALMRMARKLEGLARKATAEPVPDPDFPNDTH